MAQTVIRTPAQQRLDRIEETARGVLEEAAWADELLGDTPGAGLLKHTSRFVVSIPPAFGSDEVWIATTLSRLAPQLYEVTIRRLGVPVEEEEAMHIRIDLREEG